MSQLQQALPARDASFGGAPAAFFACTRSAPGVGPAWVRAAGELDIATSPALEQALRQAWGDAQLVLLDLRELTFMDSSGVHVIVDASRAARRGERRLIVLRPPAAVHAVLELTEMADEVEVVDLDLPQPPLQALLVLSRKSVRDS